MTSPEQFPRGSEWRRWDLHIHTPFSALNNGFGPDFEIYAIRLFKSAIANNIAVIGVTDYFTIEGYKKLRQFVEDNTRLEQLLGIEDAVKAKNILLLPNIEFRSKELIQGPRGEGKVNFHVIFSDELSVEDIEEHFLRDLKFIYESDPDQEDQYRPLTLANLEDLGRTLQSQHEEFRSETPLFTGMKNAAINHENVSKVLKAQSRRFRDKYLIVIPADEDLSNLSWDGQGHLLRKVLLQKTHMIFSSNAGTREFGLGRRHATVNDYLREFKTLKPCIHGSDAHNFEDLFVPDGERYLWIKADPTFQGLRQLLHEPEDRVFLGDQPRSLRELAKNPTRYLTHLTFGSTGPVPSNERWFSGSIPLNHGLVAVIGNKGSGKSAFADVIGLLGNSYIQSHFSFLNKERFLTPKKGLGEKFTAQATWNSGETITRQLDHKIDNSLPERVKYIPQSYLEGICSELQMGRATEFERELEEVIFSHVSLSDRLGQTTLPLLIEYRTAEKNASANRLIQLLRGVNKTIVDLEFKQTLEFHDKLEGTLHQRQNELRAHDATMPEEVLAPEQVTREDGSVNVITSELDDIVAEIATLDQSILSNQSTLNDLSLKIAASDRLLERVDNLKKTVEHFYEESNADAEVLGLDIKSLVRLVIDETEIRAPGDDAKQNIVPIRTSLDADLEGSIVSARKVASQKALETRLQLDEPNRKYQESLQQLALWTQRRKEIVGSDEEAESLTWIQTQLDDLDDVPDQLIEHRAHRNRLMRDVFEVKMALMNDYETLYSPVQDFVAKHPISRETKALEFSAAIASSQVADDVLKMIHQGKKGSFHGEQEGHERLNDLVSRSEFTSADGVQAFIDELTELLTHDFGDVTHKQTRLADQLAKGTNPEDFYNYLYGLTYLQPKFSLLWLGKPSDQLSPGERGTMLLVFFLLIDRRVIPLVIDQPEENLDNETVTSLLVPAIKFAKERRQIFIVTHNPNLAVVCDAEQIIYSTINKIEGNNVTYETGSIEASGITRHIVDVLEGTKPAFDLRDARYDVLEGDPDLWTS